MVISLLWASLALANPTDAVALHTATWAGNELHWTTTVLHGHREPIALAEPLPAEVVVTRGQVERDASGRIVALLPDRRCCVTEVELTQPGVVEGSLTLAAPVVDLPGVQRVAVREALAVPDDRLALDKHIQGWWSPPVGQDGRRSARRFARGRPEHPHRARQALYVTAADVRGRSLPVELAREASVRQGAAWKVGLVFALMLGLLAVLFRGLAEAARREKNDWYIRTKL